MPTVTGRRRYDAATTSPAEVAPPPAAAYAAAGSVGVEDGGTPILPFTLPITLES